MGRITHPIYILILVLSLIFVLTGVINAQSSSTWTTRVGNPVIQASSCPIPGGTVTCGSRDVPKGGCGHCSAQYTGEFGCSYESLAYAMDIAGSYGQDIILPQISGAQIKWTFLAQELKADGRTAIQRYGGTNETTGEQFLIKFHHSLPGSANGTRYSGEVGAKICNTPCDVGTGPHVHVEFARVNADGSHTWLDAPVYFCGG